MSIRFRTFLIVTFLALLIFVVFLLLSRGVVLPEFEAIERAEMSDHISQIENEFEEMYEDLLNLVRPYAYWDDTLLYVRGEFPEYPSINLVAEYFASVGLDYIGLANLSGEIQSEIMIDPESGRATDQPPAFHEAIAPLLEMTLYRDESSAHAGVVSVDGQLMVVAGLPVLNSEGREPAGGIAIGAQLLNDARLGDLIDSSLVSLDVYPLGDRLPEEPSLAEQHLAAADVLILPVSADTIAGYSHVHSPGGEPTALLRITTGREGLKSAQNSLTGFILTMTGIGIFGFLIAAFLLDKTVLARITSLEAWIEKRSDVTPTTERVVVKGKDEVSSLARAFNRLLDNVARAQRETERARDEALAALEFKQQLLANISHDARTPLSVIMLRTENITRGMYGAVTERQREVLDGVRASANQMLFFVNNLLAGAKLQSGGLLIRSSPFMVMTFAEDVGSMMEPLAADQGLTLEVVVDPMLPPMLIGDSDRLKQIVFNLVDNAIKFTDSGSICVFLKLNDGATWSFEVSDTGAGIAPDKLITIFEAFYQVDDSSTRKANAGVGLGLSIVKQLVGLMKGTVEVRSTVGTGTTFFVRLPLVIVGERGAV